MEIILLEAYDAGSHRRWRHGLLRAFPSWRFHVWTLPARHFSWRIRGNSLSWGVDPEHREGLQQAASTADGLLVTSMVDLSALRGFLPELARLPTAVYFHENQFAYPARGPHAEDVHPRLLQIYTALCADKLLFNSAYNRDTFLQGARALLDRLPDHVPPGLVDHMSQRAHLLPVPLEDDLFERPMVPRRVGGRPQLVWNHRWEYDKAPERLFRALELLRQRGGLEATVHVVGQQFRRQPPCFEEARRWLGPWLGRWGYVEQREEYLALLQGADIALSTALHDFQGLAVLEACALGCVPLVPDRLAYQEWFAPEHRYRSFPDAPEREARALAEALARRLEAIEEGRALEAPGVEEMRWSKMRRGYEEILMTTGATR